MILDTITAAALAIAGSTIGLREIMLSPQNETFPKAPWLLRGPMFLMAVGLAAMAYLFWSDRSIMGPYAGRAAEFVAGLSGAAAFYNVAMLINVVRQRYRPEVWRRLERAQAIVKASCAKGHLRPAPLVRRG